MILIIIVGFLMGVCMSAYARYYFQYLLARPINKRSVIFAVSLVALIFFAIAISDYLFFTSTLFERTDRGGARTLFIFSWAVPFFLTVIVGAIRLARFGSQDKPPLPARTSFAQAVKYVAVKSGIAGLIVLLALSLLMTTASVYAVTLGQGSLVVYLAIVVFGLSSIIPAVLLLVALHEKRKERG